MKTLLNIGVGCVLVAGLGLGLDAFVAAAAAQESDMEPQADQASNPAALLDFRGGSIRVYDPGATSDGPKRLSGPPPRWPHTRHSDFVSIDIQCDFDSAGHVSRCQVLGHKGGEVANEWVAFADAVRDYFLAGQYSPATRNGIPVAAPHRRFTLTYRLENERSAP